MNFYVFLCGWCRRLDIMYRSVSHQDHEYAKRISTTPGQLSNWGGTQVIDRWWLSLETFAPPTSNRKCRVRHKCASPKHGLEAVSMGVACSRLAWQKPS